MPTNGVVCLQTMIITQPPVGKHDLYRLCYKIQSYNHRFCRAANRGHVSSVARKQVRERQQLKTEFWVA